ncbi:hypothetical protein PNF2_860 (plasmid) [Nocardia farcinica IFM 10152]|uniref:Uncharacterized protein n=1 Tax=Nocardia farcinica (strain IFM 10152) TaxID=247156 RepID=Q5YM17_NOCFA|nr:hypothetical protein PNF2_860 [Nocardia farcinica IFM 10152]
MGKGVANGPRTQGRGGPSSGPRKRRNHLGCRLATPSLRNLLAPALRNSLPTP